MRAYIGIELRRLSRDGGYLMMSLALPVIAYLLVGRSGNPAADPAAQMIGIAAFGALGVSVNTCTSIAEDRARGWLRQLRLTPLTPQEVIVGRGAAAVAVVLLPILAVFVLGASLHGVALGPGEWTATTLSLLIGVTPLALFGLGLGYLFRPAIAQIVGTATYLALTALGGLFVPLDAAPGWVTAIAHISPTYLYSAIVSAVGLGHTPPWPAVMELAAWTAVAAAFAAGAYRRASRAL